jgi:hypothetical protein
MLAHYRNPPTTTRFGGHHDPHGDLFSPRQLARRFAVKVLRGTNLAW